MQEEIVNRVEKSPLITLELRDFLPNKSDMTFFDMKDCLWQDLALKEKDFRQFIKEHQWEKYSDKNVAVFCSADAIIPNWAYMLIASSLDDYAKQIYFGDLKDLERELMIQSIQRIDCDIYKNAPVVIKGCGQEIHPSLYLKITEKLKPSVKSLMFGEACSKVPIYKRKNKK